MALIEGLKIDIGNVFDGIRGIINTIREAITGELSPEQKAKIQSSLMQIEFMVNQGQQEINKVEAQHTSVFVAGWRPFVGWICGITIGCYYIPIAVMSAIVWTMSCIKDGWVMKPYTVPYSISELIGLIVGMLGLGISRTVEKLKDAQGNH